MTANIVVTAFNLSSESQRLVISLTDTLVDLQNNHNDTSKQAKTKVVIQSHKLHWRFVFRINPHGLSLSLDPKLLKTEKQIF